MICNHKLRHKNIVAITKPTKLISAYRATYVYKQQQEVENESI